MKVIFTCGGTGGHIYPAVAVARIFQQHQPGCEILFIGAEDGMETSIVPREGFRLETLRISNYQRKLTPAALWHNVTTAVHISGSMRKAGRIIREFQPDVIVGTGGYASFPALRMGARLGVPTCVHESNAMPGLTTRMVEKDASRILVSFEQSKQYYRHPERVMLTGTPVREEFFFTKRQEARKKLGLDERPLIVSYWGSLGAREMNKMIAECFRCECENGLPFQHIHATGSFGCRWMPEYVKQAGVDLASHPELDMREYIFDMPTVMAAADLVFCRAGAATIAEICASGTPCIMVPSPNVTDNHQEKNARVLESSGAAAVIREQDCSGERLFRTARELLEDPERLGAMRRAAGHMAVADAAQRIYETALALTRT